MTDTYSSNLYSKLTYQKEDGTMLTPLEFVEKTVSYVGDIVQDYRLITPWKFNVSAGTTLGGIMALGAEYELISALPVCIIMTELQWIIRMNTLNLR